MTYRSFVCEVARRTEISDLDVVEQAVADTLRALGQRLCDIDARAVADQLPPSLADHFLSAAIGEAEDARASVLTTRADHRIVRSACRLLAETLDEQARAHLRMQPLTSLFTQ